MTTLLVMTHGRGDELMQSLDSIHRNLRGKIDRWVIHSDCPDPAWDMWVRQWWGGDLIRNEGPHGFGNAIRNAWTHMDDDYIIHWEEDFVLKEEVSVDLLKEILETSPELSQVALKRQPWNEIEKAAGGFIEADPDSFTEEIKLGYVITKHQKFFTTNPSVYGRKIVELGWPDEEHSEGKFGFKVRDAGLWGSFLGAKFDPPKVEHIGYDRTGIGY
jgi:hypothetical protein